ncbi:MAG: helix-turn-helix transcriptional regulator [Planctomycetes bacterium]|nr:helix-turn-helix transcriptional regulator [Planctomycetota bacterium]
MIRRLLLDNFLPPGHHCHYGRADFGLIAAPETHHHDFLEVFWIDEGAGEHVVDGERYQLSAGSLVLVHADDRHGFTGLAKRRCRLANIAFATATWEHIRDRYFADRPDLFARSAARAYQLTDARLRLLHEFAAEIAGGARSLAAIERFLLNLAHLIGAAGTVSSTPEWLASAIARLEESQRFAEGPHALVALAGRSPEHVAREVRRCYGRTPTDVVNAARMAFAARRLAETDDDIFGICLACGLSNLGHFYRLFRAAHGATPSHYRDQHRRIVGGS